MYRLLLIFLASSVINGLPKKDNGKPEPKQLLYIIERLENGLDIAASQPQQQQQPLQHQQFEKQTAFENQRQPVPASNPYNIPILEPQFQYPGYNFLQDKQLFPRVQPQIVFYGPGGQGQPILINPGSPPGNFLVPHQPQPGPNVIIRDVPPQRPVFVAGYPKPAHIPPIEKDAEEIPTNPAKIPPLSPIPSARKPEKLETFNEGKFEFPTKSAGEADVLAAADRNPQLIPNTNIKPGHRFFILNGEDLFPSFPIPSNREFLKFAQNQPEEQQIPLYQQPQSISKQEETDIPIQPLLLRNTVTGQISNVQDFGNSETKLPENLIALNHPNTQDQALFRSSFPLEIGSDNIQSFAQFRYSPPSEPYFAFNAEDIENDSVVIDAKSDGADISNDQKEESQVSPQNDPEPSTAQAAPGAIALAGPGGVAGAAPRGTALVGKGGLAISSPQATAVAGPSKNEEKTKKPSKKN